jgi:RimJ/RimL family protein N-acetyltransferase
VPKDAADLYRIYSDPETMKFMGKAPDSVEEERDHIQSHIARHYEKYGVGFCATVLKEINRLIGRCGLMRKQIEGYALTVRSLYREFSDFITLPRSGF